MTWKRRKNWAYREKLKHNEEWDDKSRSYGL
jgi:hypothetical protein